MLDAVRTDAWGTFLLLETYKTVLTVMRLYNPIIFDTIFTVVCLFILSRGLLVQYMFEYPPCLVKQR